MNLGELVALFATFGLFSMPVYADAGPQERRLQEEITVQRLIVDARVTNANGDAVRGLGIANFEVTVDGRPAGIEAVEWIDDSDQGATASRPGRTIVLFFQRDLRVVRAFGQSKVIRNRDILLDAFREGDQVAVVMFDSRLHLLQDFTNSRDLIESAIERSLLGDTDVASTGDGILSMASSFHGDQAPRVARPEDAIRFVGSALAPVHGVKSLMVFGYGFGTYTKRGTTLDRRYDRARRTLDAARVSLFSVDITEASFHSLEHGLRTASFETGGAYVKTHEFPVNALRKVARMMKGHYELTVTLPALQRGSHDVRLKLRGARGEVLTRTSYVLE